MYKRTVKFWEYNNGWIVRKKRNVFNPWGYSVDLLEYMTYYCNDWAGIKIDFIPTYNNMARLITITAPIDYFEAAGYLLENKRKGKILD